MKSPVDSERCLLIKVFWSTWDLNWLLSTSEQGLLLRCDRRKDKEASLLLVPCPHQLVITQSQSRPRSSVSCKYFGVSTRGVPSVSIFYLLIPPLPEASIR